MKVWLNGALVAAADARIDPADRGFTLGDGLFETIRVAGGRPCHLERHLARLAEGAATLGIPLPHSTAEIAAGLGRLLEGNGLAEGSIRLTLTRGAGPRGLLPPAAPSPTLLATAAPAAPSPPPARAVIASVTRRNEHSPLSRLKSLNYLDNILARREAADRGADEALMLNTQGRLAEATVGNVFVMLDGALITPPVSEGALPGIARGLVIERLQVLERPVTVEELHRTAEIVITNSLAVRGVASLEGKPLIIGSPLMTVLEATKR
ncbi:2-keto-4-methylthiobutyrate aminotransferase [Skermanella stibiiresistens SB22]|uniref:Probable branched-chain-amino-acid aminotransferase n=1 Tax=Skermanella stibiiresistens SB22 TaxID=1385369 RepID=W9HDC6_9PROT|nr:aminotransferase class IV [Skermanella stibiiresistens]EWY42682.1 2-keto-4-methylthiobutyrate aminotransferase [Skermanella stibiiresistens SB22]